MLLPPGCLRFADSLHPVLIMAPKQSAVTAQFGEAFLRFGEYFVVSRFAKGDMIRFLSCPTGIMTGISATRKLKVKSEI